MKRKQSPEPDLFVVNKKLTAQESKEISEFIEQIKLKEKLKLKASRCFVKFFYFPFIAFNSYQNISILLKL